MTKHDELLRLVNGCDGLTAIEYSDSSDSPIVAWKLIARMCSVPILKTEDMGQLREWWLNVCSRLHIVDAAGMTLLSVGEFGSLPWLKTRVENPSFLLALCDNEIVCSSITLDTMAAITAEESGHWLFAGNRRNSDWDLLAENDPA